MWLLLYLVHNTSHSTHARTLFQRIVRTQQTANTKKTQAEKQNSQCGQQIRETHHTTKLFTRRIRS